MDSGRSNKSIPKLNDSPENCSHQPQSDCQHSILPPQSNSFVHQQTNKKEPSGAQQRQVQQVRNSHSNAGSEKTQQKVCKKNDPKVIMNWEGIYIEGKYYLAEEQTYQRLMRTFQQIEKEKQMIQNYQLNVPQQDSDSPTNSKIVKSKSSLEGPLPKKYVNLERVQSRQKKSYVEKIYDSLDYGLFLQKENHGDREQLMSQLNQSVLKQREEVAEIQLLKEQQKYRQRINQLKRLKSKLKRKMQRDLKEEVGLTLNFDFEALERKKKEKQQAQSAKSNQLQKQEGPISSRPISIKQRSEQKHQSQPKQNIRGEETPERQQVSEGKKQFCGQFKQQQPFKEASQRKDKEQGQIRRSTERCRSSEDKNAEEQEKQAVENCNSKEEGDRQSIQIEKLENGSNKDKVKQVQLNDAQVENKQIILVSQPVVDQDSQNNHQQKQLSQNRGENISQQGKQQLICQDKIQEINTIGEQNCHQQKNKQIEVTVTGKQGVQKSFESPSNMVLTQQCEQKQLCSSFCGDHHTEEQLNQPVNIIKGQELEEVRETYKINVNQNTDGIRKSQPKYYAPPIEISNHQEENISTQKFQRTLNSSETKQKLEDIERNIAQQKQQKSAQKVPTFSIQQQNNLDQGIPLQIQNEKQEVTIQEQNDILGEVRPLQREESQRVEVKTNNEEKLNNQEVVLQKQEFSKQKQETFQKKLAEVNEGEEQAKESNNKDKGLEIERKESVFTEEQLENIKSQSQYWEDKKEKGSQSQQQQKNSYEKAETITLKDPPTVNSKKDSSENAHDQQINYQGEKSPSHHTEKEKEKTFQQEEEAAFKAGLKNKTIPAMFQQHPSEVKNSLKDNKTSQADIKNSYIQPQKNVEEEVPAVVNDKANKVMPRHQNPSVDNGQSHPRSVAKSFKSRKTVIVSQKQNGRAESLSNQRYSVDQSSIKNNKKKFSIQKSKNGQLLKNGQGINYKVRKNLNQVTKLSQKQKRSQVFAELIESHKTSQSGRNCSITDQKLEIKRQSPEQAGQLDGSSGAMEQTASQVLVKKAQLSELFVMIVKLEKKLEVIEQKQSQMRKSALSKRQAQLNEIEMKDIDVQSAGNIQKRSLLKNQVIGAFDTCNEERKQFKSIESRQQQQQPEKNIQAKPQPNQVQKEGKKIDKGIKPCQEQNDNIANKIMKSEGILLTPEEGVERLSRSSQKDQKQLKKDSVKEEQSHYQKLIKHLDQEKLHLNNEIKHLRKIVRELQLQKISKQELQNSFHESSPYNTLQTENKRIRNNKPIHDHQQQASQVKSINKGNHQVVITSTPKIDENVRIQNKDQELLEQKVVFRVGKIVKNTPEKLKVSRVLSQRLGQPVQPLISGVLDRNLVSSEFSENGQIGSPSKLHRQKINETVSKNFSQMMEQKRRQKDKQINILAMDSNNYHSESPKKMRVYPKKKEQKQIFKAEQNSYSERQDFIDQGLRSHYAKKIEQAANQTSDQVIFDNKEEVAQISPYGKKKYVIRDKKSIWDKFYHTDQEFKEFVEGSTARKKQLLGETLNSYLSAREQYQQNSSPQKSSPRKSSRGFQLKDLSQVVPKASQALNPQLKPINTNYRINNSEKVMDQEIGESKQKSQAKQKSETKQKGQTNLQSEVKKNEQNAKEQRIIDSMSIMAIRNNYINHSKDTLLLQDPKDSFQIGSVHGQKSSSDQKLSLSEDVTFKRNKHQQKIANSVKQVQELGSQLNLDLLQGLIAPSIEMDQQKLFEVAKQTFKHFYNYEVLLQDHDFFMKKYKNCVIFTKNHETIIWHYDGKFYSGGWKVKENGEGEKSGQGLELTPGKTIYKGQFLKGRKHGTGTIKYSNGNIYTGQWKQGFKEGKGVQIQQKTGIIYHGQWSKGKKTGFGLLKYSQDEFYEGTLTNSAKSGYGQEFFSNGDRYKGEYEKGKFHGKGIYQWSNGSFYEGQFREGVRHGRGMWSSDSIGRGDLYVGAYCNDKKNGYGKYTWENGSVYQGNFLEDLKHGPGKIIEAKTHRQIKGIWEKGTLIESIGSQRDLEKHSQQPLKNAC